RSARSVWSRKGSATSMTVRLACRMGPTGPAGSTGSAAGCFGGARFGRGGFIGGSFPFLGHSGGLDLLRFKRRGRMGELLLFGITAHQCIEACLASICFRSQHPAESLRLFLAGAEGPGDLNQDLGVR